MKRRDLFKGLMAVPFVRVMNTLSKQGDAGNKKSLLYNSNHNCTKGFVCKMVKPGKWSPYGPF